MPFAFYEDLGFISEEYSLLFLADAGLIMNILPGDLS
jgi:hypothetical protein